MPLALLKSPMLYGFQGSHSEIACTWLKGVEDSVGRHSPHPPADCTESPQDSMATGGTPQSTSAAVTKGKGAACRRAGNTVDTAHDQGWVRT